MNRSHRWFDGGTEFADERHPIDARSAHSRLPSVHQQDSRLAAFTNTMSQKVFHNMRLCAAVIGGGATIALSGVAVYCMQGEQVSAAGGSSAPVTTTTEPTVPAIEKAVPSITGPAPLYAGEAPNSNPQAAIP
jgi:hypothetical protein